MSQPESHRLTREQAELVRRIRAQCAREFEMDPDEPFFHANYIPGEHPDRALLRLFREERQAQLARYRISEIDEAVIIDTLIYG